MKKSTYLVIALFVAGLSCQDPEATDSKSVKSPTKSPIVSVDMRFSSPNSNARYVNPIPDAMVVLNTTNNNLQSYPWRNSTFYGNNGGATIGTGYSPSWTYLTADWDASNASTDLVMVDGAGNLRFSYCKGSQYHMQSSFVGTGFNNVNAFLVGKWNGTKSELDLIIVQGQSMYLYPFWCSYDCTFSHIPSTFAGRLSSIYTDFFVADWNNDGLSDLLGRDSNGNLDLYIFNGGQFGQPSRVGHGFNFTNYFLGDWTNDGLADLLVRDSSGNLKFYPMSLRLSFYNNGGGAIVGTNFFYRDYYVWDWSGDGIPDIIGRDGNNDMNYVPYQGAGYMSGTYLVGNGWFYSQFAAHI